MTSNKRRILRRVVIGESIIVLLAVNLLLIMDLDKTFATEEKAQVQVEVQKTPLADNKATEKPKKVDLSKEAKKVAKTEKKQTLTLVNSKKSLPKDYKVKLSTYAEQGKTVATLILDPLSEMLSAGEKKGLSFAVCSAYRSNAYQKRIFNVDMEKYQGLGYSYDEAYKKTAFSIQPSGYSEHATGYAVDIVSKKNRNLDKTQEETKEFKWLKKNCYKYGFILRYPDDKSDITGIIYEPWHFRYVGKQVAKFITEHKLTLEEFTELVEKK